MLRHTLVGCGAAAALVAFGSFGMEAGAAPRGHGAFHGGGGFGATHMASFGGSGWAGRTGGAWGGRTALSGRTAYYGGSHGGVWRDGWRHRRFGGLGLGFGLGFPFGVYAASYPYDACDGGWDGDDCGYGYGYSRSYAAYDYPAHAYSDVDYDVGYAP